MKGFIAPEVGHVVNILPPVDITGGKTAQAFTMKLYQHVSIFVLIGVSAAAFTKIIVNQCTDASGSNPVAIPRRCRPRRWYMPRLRRRPSWQAARSRFLRPDLQNARCSKRGPRKYR